MSPSSEACEAAAFDEVNPEGGVDRLHEMAKDMRTETHQHNVSVEPRTARAREWGVADDG